MADRDCYQNTLPAHHWSTGNFDGVLKEKCEVNVIECCHLFPLKYLSLSGLWNMAGKERGGILFRYWIFDLALLFVFSINFLTGGRMCFGLLLRGGTDLNNNNVTS